MNPIRSLAAVATLFLFVLAVSSACDRAPAPTTEPAADAPIADAAVQTVELSYEIEGMHCSGCVDAITIKVSKVPGVEHCSVDLDSKRAVISVIDGSADAAVRAAVERLGYKIHPLTDTETPTPPKSAGH